jgi:carboxyl-terminal processing protease
MKRRLLYGSLVTVLALNLVVGFHIYFSSVGAAEKDEAYPNLKLFSVVLDRVRTEYVDGNKLTYQEPIKYDDLKKDTQGEFGGVGIVISMRDNFLTVVAPMEDTPGFKAGILPGDRIIKIDGRSTERLSLTDAVKNLRGEPGSEVSISVLRPSSGKVKDYHLTRAQIKVDTIKDINGHREFPLSENKVGYIKIVQFGEHTAADLEDALKKLESKGVESLILDLRSNPGGLLDQAVKVCEKFLPARQLIVSTEGRDARQKSEYRATGRDRHATLPMVVLVNNGSASASEIVAGCLQDTTAAGVSKAILVGETTFGKGSVQSILPLQDGSALRLTTAKYYTPSHKVIHQHGVTPDIIVPMSDEDERYTILQRTVGGVESLEPKEQEKARDVRDVQMDRAMDLLKGISLYSKRLPAMEKKQQHGKADKVAAAR